MDVVDAREAHHWGLVNELVSQGWDFNGTTYFVDGNLSDYSKDFEAGTLKGAQGTIPGTFAKEDFKKTVLQGRIDKGMPNFDGSQQVVDNIDNLYAYLKGRSDGAIAPGKLQEAGK